MAPKKTVAKRKTKKPTSPRGRKRKQTPASSVKKPSKKRSKKEKKTEVLTDGGACDKSQEDQISKRELELVTSMRTREDELASQGYKMVVGTDEAGRGPLAGPVVCAACWVPSDVIIPGIADSKALTEEQREKLYEKLTTHPKVIWEASVQDNHVIDDINILAASLKGMAESVEGLSTPADYVLVDGNRDPPFKEGLEFETVVKGDAKCYCIAAASIIAKVTRDRMMYKLDKKYPVYKLAQHKGYPTKLHKELVLKHGPSPIHRITFAPIKTMEGTDLTGTYWDPKRVVERKIAAQEAAKEKRRAAKLARQGAAKPGGGTAATGEGKAPVRRMTDFFPSAKKKTVQAPKGGKRKQKSNRKSRGPATTARGKKKSRTTKEAATKTQQKKRRSRKKRLRVALVD